MIGVVTSPQDPMGAGVAHELSERGVDFALVSVHDIPNTVRLELGGQSEEDRLLFADGTRLQLSELKAVFHRVGFANFEVYEEYSEAETRFVNDQCQMALCAWLNTCRGLVINRPYASSSNASKPYQAAVIGRHGFLVPRTIVTNLPESARSFYEECEGEVIYKSISYHRSIVQKMTEADLARLEALNHCPVQLQMFIPGTDVRVHVVGDRGVFAARIESDSADYRYDRESELTPFALPEDTAERCVRLAKSLDLVLAGIDLRITPDGQICCFEVNPSPAFRWYEDRTGQPITAAVVDCLVEASQSM